MVQSCHCQIGQIRQKVKGARDLIGVDVQVTQGGAFIKVDLSTDLVVADVYMV